MATQRHHQRLWMWIAGLAILFNALMPAFNAAVMAAQGAVPSGLAVFCSSNKNRSEVSLTQASWRESTVQKRSGSDSGNHEDMPSKHCPACLIHADTLALPPVPLASSFVLPMGEALLPARFLQAPRTSYVWASAQPRAPPLQA